MRIIEEEKGGAEGIREERSGEERKGERRGEAEWLQRGSAEPIFFIVSESVPEYRVRKALGRCYHGLQRAH